MSLNAAHNHNTSLQDRQGLKRLASYASIGVCVILILSKAFAFFLTGSVAILSSLLDSLMDAVASGIALAGVLHAQKPADRGHRYGHGKAEALAALAQTALITASAVLLAAASVSHLLDPQPLAHEWAGIGVMVLSIVLTCGLLVVQRHVIRKTESLAVDADHVHYSGDLLMNLGVMASLALSLFTDWTWIDPLFGLAASAYMLAAIGKVGRRSLDVLMDHELPPQDRQQIKDIVKGHPMARGIHDIRTRSAGDRVFIEFHLELDPDLTLARAHDLAHEVEDLLKAAFPHADIIIHQEPAGIDDPRMDLPH
ncbi:MAG: cation diffusion facilitator family transporter [Pseudomonadota bacterium]|nr:cation diffusion facilitator family transporter [Pseudomonadota bacterium]